MHAGQRSIGRLTVDAVRSWSTCLGRELIYIVGDITTEYKPPRWGRFTLNYIEAHEDQEDGALLIKA